MKFNAQRLLFELFSDIIGNFGSVELKIESTFPFQYNIIFENGVARRITGVFQP